eukprot:scaffold327_cov166-Isochrysis_galbana.AAC.2
MPGDVPGGRSGVQSYLRRALTRAVRADSFGALLRGRVNLLQLQQKLARRHCDPPRARGVEASLPKTPSKSRISNG